MSDISKRILPYLEATGFSYAELSVRTGIPKSALQRYCTGTTEKIPLDRLERIAQALNVSITYLLGWESQLPVDTSKTPTAESSERPINDDDIKFALFGGEGEITDAMYEEVRQFAEFVKNREAQKKQKKE